MKRNSLDKGIIKRLVNNIILFYNNKFQFGLYRKKKYNPVIESLSLRAKTRSELAEEYCISERTLTRWFERERIEIPSGLIYPSNLKVIYSIFGVPEKLKKG